MEVKTYLLILWRERAIVLLCITITLVGAYLFTSNQPEIYEASATFVMRPRAELVEDEQESVRVLDTLGRHVSIGSTYVEVAGSKLIRKRAIESLGLSPDQYRGLSIDGSVKAGTNILIITGEGTNPAIVSDFTNQIGQETVEYVSSLYDIFELEPLDAATPPNNPVRPNLILNLILGGVLGLAVGVAIAFISTYLRAPHINARHFDIIEPVTGAYTAAYFRLRLQQEVSRSRRSGEHFAVALIRVTKSAQVREEELLRLAAVFLQTELRDADLLAYAGDCIFAILLVGVDGGIAKEQVHHFCSNLRSAALMKSNDANIWDIKCAAGVSSYDGVDVSADELWAQAAVALDDIGPVPNGKMVALYSQLEGIFKNQRSLRKVVS